MATLDGQDVFGVCKIIPSFDATAQQVNDFFGINGVQALHGGERGFALMIDGMFVGVTEDSVLDQELLLLSFRDGIARLLVDNRGRPWPQIVFSGAYQRWEHGVKPCYVAPTDSTGFAMGYKCVLRGLGG